MIFGEVLIDWYKVSGRDLPWRSTNDPYVIWLSEIILQQTRVEQGMPYFFKFLDRFPTVAEFASADEEEILRLWQGLGYYSRARNMHRAAKLVVEDFDGVFPSEYNSLLKLPGVGEYTAAAISSFSVNEDRAVLDGNVFRVLSRYFGVSDPINSTKGKEVFKQLANQMLPIGRAGTYNQAIMDFGAILCKPKSPLCNTCVFQLDCVAFKNELISMLPVKLKGKVSQNRYFHYFIVENEGEILMSKRGAGDVWENLYEFPLIETVEDVDLAGLVETVDFQNIFKNMPIEQIGGQVKHVLSHQNIYAKFYKIGSESLNIEKKTNWNYFLLENLDKLAKHKLIFTFVNKYVLN